MKFFLKFFIALYLIFTTASCTKHNDDRMTLFSEIINLTPNVKLTEELGIYTNNFILNNGNVNIQSTEFFSALGHKRFSSRINVWHFDDLNNINGLNDGGSYFVNDLEYRYTGGRYLPDREIDFQNFDAFYNEHIYNDRPIEIKNIKNGEIVFSEQLSPPKKLKIGEGLLNNKIDETSFFKADRDNLLLNYNYDAGNDHGILIKISYQNENINMSMDDFENKGPSEEVKRALHLKHEQSNGQIKIPAELFDDIPDGAIVTMYIGRGDGAVFHEDDKVYFIAVGHDQQFRIVLE